MSSNVAALQAASDALQFSLDRIGRRLQQDIDDRRQFGHFTANYTPDDMRDSSGRYILLDARIAHVNALAALVNAEA